MDSPKISTIIPVYNVERYLTHSLDSIANQTYKNLEIICIDDGSSDNSRTILEEYAKKDSRINVIKQENTGGLGYYARNAGLKIAKGDYLSFADPDDYIDLDFYEKLIAAALKTKADIVCAATRWLDVQGKVTRITLGTADSDNVKKDFAKILSSLQHGAVWNKLYARDLIFKNNLYFHGYCGEDNFFTISALYHCNKISSVKDAYYNYRQSNPLSAGNNPAQKAANERIEGVFFVAQETLDFIGAKFAGDKKIHKETLLFLEKSLLGRIKDKRTYLNRIYKIFGLSFIIGYILRKIGKAFYRNYINRYGYHKIKILYIPVYSKKASL